MSSTYPPPLVRRTGSGSALRSSDTYFWRVLARRRRRPSLPHIVDQPLRGNDAAGVEEQASQDGPLAEPAQRDPSGLVVHLQRPEDGELHHAPPTTP